MGRLSLRIAGASVVGNSRGTIVDCGGSLARFRLDEWGIVWGKVFKIKEKGLTITRKSLDMVVGGRRLELRTPGL